MSSNVGISRYEDPEPACAGNAVLPEADLCEADLVEDAPGEAASGEPGSEGAGLEGKNAGAEGLAEGSFALLRSLKKRFFFLLMVARYGQALF